ncbi:MAG: LPS assembly lipoprotein LptE [Caulobacteraceae bacterium]
MAAFALSATCLASCGFTPLYATPGVSPGLASIQVVAPQGRVGFLLREDLDDALGHDKAAAPLWRLDMTVTQTRDPRGLNVIGVAERYVLGVGVNYALTEVATGKVVHAGQVASHVSYDAADAPYAGIAARQDSQERAASDAARRIQLDLAAWMAARAGKTAPPAG